MREVIIINHTLATAILLIIVGVSACSEASPDSPKATKAGGNTLYVSTGDSVPASGVLVGSLKPIEDGQAPLSEAGFLKAGAVLYTTLCSQCHGDIKTTNRRGRTDVGKIRDRYVRNFPTHKNLVWPNIEEEGGQEPEMIAAVLAKDYVPED